MSVKRELARDTCLSDIPLAPFTYWQIGGPAKRFFWPTSLPALQQFLRDSQHAPALQTSKIIFLGLGSNVLVPDEGLDATVVITQGAFSDMGIVNQTQVCVGAGASCAQVARFAAKNNLVKGEFLAGIPGTVGGALFMNAGAFGGETWPRVASVKTIDRSGNIKTRHADTFHYAYRHCEGLAQDEWFIEATFQFTPGDGEQSLKDIRALLDKRKETQPTGEPSCGSVFRNPPGDYAARLIESLGLKGYRQGDAEVSPKHANFIINTDAAQASYVKALIEMIQTRVRTAYAIELVREVVYL